MSLSEEEEGEQEEDEEGEREEEERKKEERLPVPEKFPDVEVVEEGTGEEEDGEEERTGSRKGRRRRTEEAFLAQTQSVSGSRTKRMSRKCDKLYYSVYSKVLSFFFSPPPC